MRTALLAALLGSTVFIAAAAAQQPPQGATEAKAAIAECEALEAYLVQAKPANPGVTIEQVRAWQQSSQPQPCQENLRRLTESASATPPANPNPSGPAAAAPATAQTTAPAGAAPATTTGTAQVVVQQAQPNVTVRQAQPEIIVRQAPPLITVQQPQPEIIVRMPPPDVNVSMARPEVQVSVPQPQVQVVPPQAQTQANVQVDNQQPNVRFERTGEPQIIYQPAEGQPQIRFEPQGQANVSTTQAQPGAAPQNPQNAQAQLNTDQRGYGTAGAANQAAAPVVGPAQTGALPPSPGLQAVKASDLEDMALYNGRGEKMGEVDSVLMGTDNKAYILISHGGFLGLGQKQVALATDQIAMRGDRLIADGLTDEQVRALPEFKESANFKEMDDAQTTSLRMAQ